MVIRFFIMIISIYDMIRNCIFCNMLLAGGIINMFYVEPEF